MFIRQPKRLKIVSCFSNGSISPSVPDTSQDDSDYKCAFGGINQNLPSFIPVHKHEYYMNILEERLSPKDFFVLTNGATECSLE